MANYTQHLQQVTPSPSPSPQLQYPRSPTQPRTRLQGRRGVTTQSAPPTTPQSHHSSVLLPAFTLKKAGNPGASRINATPGPSRRDMVRTRSRSAEQQPTLGDLTVGNLARHDDGSIQTIPIAGSSLLDLAAIQAMRKEQDDRLRRHLPTHAQIVAERQRNYPTNHAIRVVKRACTKLANELTVHQASFSSLEKLLKEAVGTVNEATRRTREVVWLRFCLEHDLLKKVKKERKYWDGTLVGGDRVREWREFLEEVKREKEEKGKEALEKLDRELEELDGSDESGSDDGRDGGSDDKSGSESRKRARDTVDDDQQDEEQEQMKRARRDIVAS
ncbi:hypothetical protein PC9H_007954 [Pleurotus ostreatus]|uniref:Uncharacterized protein n=1 Tax=Pleurotus ostreatus TaxID=5322 RepID=A0A8H6ZS39_PLEOS|nr:uncharacterized protein PC9H_007954 [Pleurotus ostreatus]KAF7428725.1 hypothetical protein PC9H_007954 [Pleurotus ostreatus]KAJ8696923.1 hypothetical protein PTI98_006744 [Pleurotus ostreatus]